MAEEDFDLEIGAIVYKNDAARLIDTVMPQVAERIEEMAMAPESVRQAFFYDIAHWTSRYQVFCHALLSEDHVGTFDTDGSWHGEDTEALVKRVFTFVNDDEYATKTIDRRTRIVNIAMDHIDQSDKQNVQMVIVRDQTREDHEEKAFTYVVVYPPEEDNGRIVRRREVSFPTAMCHTISTISLMDDTLLARVFDASTQSQEDFRQVNIGDEKFATKLFKIDKVSDVELLDIVSTHGRTLPDRIIQAGLNIIDKWKRRKGEHIDPISALRDQQYALYYTYACHRGVGGVVNDKIKLPPIEVE